MKRDATVGYRLTAGGWTIKDRWWCYLLTICLAVSVTAGCTSSRTAAGPADGDREALALQDCTLSVAEYGIQRRAECGKLKIFENTESQAGRQIELNIAVIPAESQNPEPDPLFMIAGGPGQAATQAYLPILGALRGISFERDIVLIDQRGTGHSAPLTCDDQQLDSEVELLGEDIPVEEQVAELRTCVEMIDADFTQYGTPEAVADLEAVRLALGYDQVNLLGVSYGTRVALFYMREYPQNVRSVVLSGIVPPGFVLGETIEADAERSLNLVFGRCEADPGCNEAFPNLRLEFQDLVARLEEEPVEVTIPDPLTAEPLPVLMTRTVTTAVIRYMTYSEDYTALIPLLIHQAAEGDLEPLAAQYAILITPTAEALSYGMFLAVTCGEDVPYLNPEQDPPDTFFTYDEATFQQLCTVISTEPLPDEYRQPVQSNLPVLILSGEADPVTPPANGDIIAETLPNSLHIVMNGIGHGPLVQGCLPRVISDFIENKSTSGLDTGCVDRIKPLPFFTSPVGPQP